MNLKEANHPHIHVILLEFRGFLHSFVRKKSSVWTNIRAKESDLSCIYETCIQHSNPPRPTTSCSCRADVAPDLSCLRLSPNASGACPVCWAEVLLWCFESLSCSISQFLHIYRHLHVILKKGLTRLGIPVPPTLESWRFHHRNQQLGRWFCDDMQGPLM